MTPETKWTTFAVLAPLQWFPRWSLTPTPTRKSHLLCLLHSRQQLLPPRVTRTKPHILKSNTGKDQGAALTHGARGTFTNNLSVCPWKHYHGLTGLVQIWEETEVRGLGRRGPFTARPDPAGHRRQLHTGLWCSPEGVLRRSFLEPPTQTWKQALPHILATTMRTVNWKQNRLHFDSLSNIIILWNSKSYD